MRRASPLAVRTKGLDVDGPAVVEDEAGALTTFGAVFGMAEKLSVAWNCSVSAYCLSSPRKGRSKLEEATTYRAETAQFAPFLPIPTSTRTVDELGRAARRAL